MPDTDRIHEFQERVWAHYAAHYRPMPWRDTPEPYFVLVSELMLQQTQVARVIPKFNAFVRRFPDIDTLARAELADVLALWSGLGYNRRAKYLQESAKRVAEQGEFPSTLESLMSLPGVGRNTAAAILNYAFEQPMPFVETNIRSVFIHEFFRDTEELIDDTAILHLVERTLSSEDVRQWFYALMDYGSYLKSQGLGRNARSKQYKKQPALKGSLRETRGAIMKYLTRGACEHLELRQRISMDDRFDLALARLLSDGLIEVDGNTVRLTGQKETS